MESELFVAWPNRTGTKAFNFKTCSFDRVPRCFIVANLLFATSGL